MRDLDRTVAYDLRDLSDEQTELLFEQMRKQSVHKFDYKRNHETNFTGYELNNNWYTAEFARDLEVKNVVNALTLFEPQFKRGDKVLVRDYDDEDWIDGFYIVEHRGRHYVESYDEFELLSYKFIKPYEEEKKWYVVDRGVDSYYSVLSEDEVLWSKAEDKRVEEITDPEFIKHLEANAN